MGDDSREVCIPEVVVQVDDNREGDNRADDIRVDALGVDIRGAVCPVDGSRDVSARCSVDPVGFRAASVWSRGGPQHRGVSAVYPRRDGLRPPDEWASWRDGHRLPDDRARDASRADSVGNLLQRRRDACSADCLADSNPTGF